jgi:hypothetical protein
MDNLSRIKSGYKSRRSNTKYRVSRYSLSRYSNKSRNSSKSINQSKRSLISNYKNNILNSFIMFGCWNDVDCGSWSNTNWDRNPIYRDIVLSKIKKEKEKLIIILGDNWYPQSYIHNKSKYKYYPFDVLLDGYNKLFSKSKLYDIILGNHDEDNDDIINPVKKDCMLKTQKYVVNKLSNNLNILKLPSLEDLQYTSTSDFYNNNIDFITAINKPVLKELNRGIYIIYINTNLFDDYTYILTKYPRSDDKHITYKKLLAYVSYILKLLRYYNPKLLFVAGHTPLIASKNRKLHKLDNIYTDPNSLYIMKMLLDNLNRYKTVYLCADVHNFNIALLNNNIATVVSGTGGAEPDYENVEGKVNYLIPPNEELFNVSNHYVYNSFGYTKIKYDKKFNVYVSYKQIINANKDKKLENKVLYKSVKVYNFLLKNNADGWEFIKKQDKTSNIKIKLDIPKLVNDKIKMCKKIKSNNDKNITTLNNQIIKSSNKILKQKYLENDNNTALLCYYKRKKIKNK